MCANFRWPATECIYFLLVFVFIFGVHGPLSAQSLADVRNCEPIVVTGQQLPALLGKPVARIFVYTYSKVLNSWVPIRFQVDERAWHDIAVAGDPEHPHAYELLYHQGGEEGNGFDADDEVVFMWQDAGDRAPATAWIPDADKGRYEVIMTDSLQQNLTRYAYIFAADSLQPEFQGQYVTYTGWDAITVDTDNFFVSMGGRWALDQIRVKPQGGGNNNDLIDLLKFRVYSQCQNAFCETEVYWSEGHRSWHLWDVVGPVRAIRQIQGAASGPNTIYKCFFYDRQVDWEISLRVHPIPNIWIYLDYDSANLPGLYYDADNDSVIVNGQSVRPTSTKSHEWGQVSSSAGSLVMWVDNHAIPGQDSSYYRDDANFDDGTGFDPGAFGNHGLYIANTGGTEDSARVAIVRLYPLPANSPRSGDLFHMSQTYPINVLTTLQYHSGTVPVELVSFSGFREKTGILLHWVTASETNCAVFIIQRQAPEADFAEIGRVAGNGTSSVAHAYTFFDPNTSPGKFTYRLLQADTDGSVTVGPTIEVAWRIEKFSLSPNYPNPFNPTTTLEYSLPGTVPVSLSIFDTAGRLIRHLVEGKQREGWYTVHWDSRDDAYRVVPSGTYFVRMKAGNFVQIRKCVLLR